MEQDYKARAAAADAAMVPETNTEFWHGAKWDNEPYSPKRFSCIPGGEHIQGSQLMALLYRYPVVGDEVQMVIENRDSPEPEVRPFKIVQVLDKYTGLVNGMLFMANSDIRVGEPGILGGGMSQAIRSAGFEVPNAVRGVFWLDRVRFHPVGLPRQQTRSVEKRMEPADTNRIIPYTYEMAEEPQWESPGVPLLEATWRWCQ